MTDFFDRFVARTLGLRPLLQPVLPTPFVDPGPEAGGVEQALPGHATFASVDRPAPFLSREPQPEPPPRNAPGHQARNVSGATAHADSRDAGAIMNRMSPHARVAGATEHRGAAAAAEAPRRGVGEPSSARAPTRQSTAAPAPGSGPAMAAAAPAADPHPLLSAPMTPPARRSPATEAARPAPIDADAVPTVSGARAVSADVPPVAAIPRPFATGASAAVGEPQAPASSRLQALAGRGLPSGHADRPAAAAGAALLATATAIGAALEPTASAASGAGSDVRPSEARGQRLPMRADDASDQLRATLAAAVAPAAPRGGDRDRAEARQASAPHGPGAPKAAAAPRPGGHGRPPAPAMPAAAGGTRSASPSRPAFPPAEPCVEILIERVEVTADADERTVRASTAGERAAPLSVDAYVRRQEARRR